MGFSCGIYKVKKMGKCQSIEDFNLISSYISWKRNPWNFQEDHYPTFKKYWESFHSIDKKEFPGEPDMDTVKMYESLITEENDYIGGACELFSACSVGRCVDGYLTQKLRQVNQFDFDGFSDEVIKDIILWALSKNKDSIQRVYVKNGVKRENKDDEESDVTSVFPIDGIVVESLEGWEKTIMKDEEYLFSQPALYINVNPDELEEEEADIRKDLANTMVELIGTPWDEYLVWYSNSY